MTIEYRTPTPGDLSAVMGLMPALYNEIGPGLEKVLAEFIEDKYYFKLLAVEKQSGAAAGFLVGCCRLEVDFECRAGALEEVVVRPDCRGLGIGKALLAEFEKWAAARGAQGIIVPCGREGFYEKMGFQKCPITRYWRDIPQG
ncbi:MAG: GNAT family N-acetyltransferase [Elusimicrobiota bacterium]|nr:GNAT family N-acetyltransferase [Elusimicrobiota bacterium]